MKHRQKQGRKNLRGTYGTGKGQSTIPRYTIGSKQELGVEEKGLLQELPWDGYSEPKPVLTIQASGQWSTGLEESSLASYPRRPGTRVDVVSKQQSIGLDITATQRFLERAQRRQLFRASDSTAQKSWEGSFSHTSVKNPFLQSRSEAPEKLAE